MTDGVYDVIEPRGSGVKNGQRSLKNSKLFLRG